MDETLCFEQSIGGSYPVDVLAIVRAVAEPSSVGLDHIGLGVSILVINFILAANLVLGCSVTRHIYYTETTVAIAPYTVERRPPPLWFFLFSRDGTQGVANCPDIPWGFWSLEKTPAAIPTSVMFDETLQVEHITEDCEAPLSIWTQVLGEFTFTVQTKYAQCYVGTYFPRRGAILMTCTSSNRMHASIVNLSEDELLILREIQENRRSAGGSNTTESGGSGTRSPWDDSDNGSKAGTDDSNGSDPHDGDGDKDTDGDDTNNAIVSNADSLEPINCDHYDQTYLELADAAYATSDSASVYHEAEEYHIVGDEAIEDRALSL